MKTTKDYKLDIRGMMTSYGLLKVAMAFDALSAGQTLDVLTADDATGNDILKVLKQFPHTVLEVRQIADGYAMRLMKGTRGCPH